MAAVRSVHPEIAGHPLYRFAQDRPGELKGKCKDGVFFAATAVGGNTTMSAP